MISKDDYLIIYNVIDLLFHSWLKEFVFFEYEWTIVSKKIKTEHIYSQKVV